MKVVFDEDLGTSIPDALRLVGHDASSMMSLRLLGRPDDEWLPIVGRNGWLVISKNRRMLRHPVERELIIRHRVGIIYVTWDVIDWPGFLKLMHTKWQWLQSLEIMPRPFALFLNAAGRTSDRFKNYRLIP